MMTITSKRGQGLNYWGSLVNPDKSPSPLLIQLCLGIAQLMSTLEPSNTENLTPQKIATFYRAVGGNYDTLFLSMRHSALSLVYQSLGCFHTLQPTNNAFEAPSIPALLPHGFVRWQTIQLLLCPDEHVRFLQEAVKRFDVVNPAGGGTFPKAIPREAFPAAPDPEMVEWHETVSQRLEQDAQTKLNTAAVPPPTNRSEGFHNRSSSIDSDNTVESPDYFSRRAPPSAKGPHGRGPRNTSYEERQTTSLPGSRRQSAVEEPLRPVGRFNDRDSYGFDATRLRPQPSIEEAPRQRRSKSSTRSDRQARRPVTPGHKSRSRLNAVEVSSDTESDEDSDSGWPKPQARRIDRREREMERERQNRRYKHDSDSVSPTNPSRPHSHDATYSGVRRRQQQRERSFSPRHPTELDEDDLDVEEDDDPDPEEPYTMPVNMNTRPTITRNLHYPHIPPPRPPPTTTPPSSRSSRSASVSGSHSSGNSHFQASRAPNPFKVPFREYIFQDDLPADPDADARAGNSGRGTSKNKASKPKSKPKPNPSKFRRESASEMPTSRYHVPKYTTTAPTPTPPPPPPPPQPTQTPSRHHSRKNRNLPHLTTTTLPQTQTQPPSRPYFPARTESDQPPTGGGNINARRVRAQSHTRPPPPPAMNPGYGHDRERSRWSIGGGVGMGGVWD